MTTSKPTIVFCHGAWHYPEYFSKVIAILEPLGYKCVAVQLPGAGNVPPVENLDGDFAVVRNAVTKELDDGNNVVMHAHSLGGVVVGGALEGLSVAERKVQGKASGVVKLSFASAFVLPEEMSLLDALGGKPDPKTIVREDGTTWRDDFSTLLYNDVPEDEAEELVAKLRPQALVSFLTPPKYAAWRKIPSAYLICENDNTFPVEGQEAVVAAIKEAGAVIDVERLFVSHSPHISRPGYVASFIRRAAGEKVDI